MNPNGLEDKINAIVGLTNKENKDVKDLIHDTFGVDFKNDEIKPGDHFRRRDYNDIYVVTSMFGEKTCLVNVCEGTRCGEPISSRPSDGPQTLGSLVEDPNDWVKVKASITTQDIVL